MNKRTIIKEFVFITLATALLAVSFYFFMVPSNVSIGSVSGLAIILEQFLPLRMSVIALILNGALLLLGFLLIGREFGAKTIYTSLLLPVLIGVFEQLFPNNTSLSGDAFIDVICYLFVVSFGQSILFARNASSGGLDIVGKIMNKFLRMDIGKSISLVGMCIALSSIFVFDKKTAVISVLGTYLNGMVLDHFIFGSNIKRRVCIISAKQDEIVNYVLNTLHSGATLYEAKGAYTNTPVSEVIVIVNKQEYRLLMDFVSKTDPKAFVTIYNVNEVVYQPKTIRT